MAEQLEFMKSTAMYFSPQYSDMPKPSQNIRKTEDAIIRVLDCEERIRKQHAKLDEINETINSVSNPTAQAILVKRYLGGKTWVEIAQEMYISERHTRRVHNDGLAEVDRLLKLDRECP